jgi:hypothetical protein
MDNEVDHLDTHRPAETGAESAGSGAPSPWDAFLAESGVLLSLAPDRTEENLLLRAQNSLAEVPGRDRLLLVECWPRLGIEDAAIARKLWHLTQPAHQDAYLTQGAELRAALPEITLELLPLGSLLEGLLAGAALSDIPFAHFFTPEAPGGTHALTALAALVVAGARAPEGLPEEPVEAMHLSAPLAEAYDALRLEIEEMVGGSLLPPPPPTPVRLEGTTEDDLLVLTAEADVVAGGAGTDHLLLQGLVEEFGLEVGPEGQLLLHGDGRSIEVLEVERLVFEDGTLAFDEAGLAGQAYRLYQACFDRVPDAEGLGFWIRQLDAGNVSLTQAAGHFITSEEFAQVYGSPETVADTTYLSLLYGNVLDRGPDAAGFTFWRDQQEKGITRADMLVHFSESTENVAKVAPAIDDGIWYL